MHGVMPNAHAMHDGITLHSTVHHTLTCAATRWGRGAARRAALRVGLFRRHRLRHRRIVWEFWRERSAWRAERCRHNNYAALETAVGTACGIGALCGRNVRGRCVWGKESCRKIRYAVLRIFRRSRLWHRRLARDTTPGLRRCCCLHGTHHSLRSRPPHVRAADGPGRRAGHAGWRANPLHRGCSDMGCGSDGRGPGGRRPAATLCLRLVSSMVLSPS